VSDHPRGIIDISVVLSLADLPTQALPAEPVITAITLAELSVGPLVARTAAERAARQAHLQQAEADFEPLPFDAASARAWPGRRVTTRGWAKACGPGIRRPDRRDGPGERPAGLYRQPA